MASMFGEDILNPVNSFTVQSLSNNSVETNEVKGNTTNSGSSNNASNKMEQEQTQSKSEEAIEFIKPKNDTDPWVRHDPTVPRSVLVRKRQPQDNIITNEDDSNHGAGEYYDQIRTDGKLYPLVKVNSLEIENNNILNMCIYYRDFLPTISLTVRDNKDILKKIDTPGMNNQITVVMVPETDDVYQSISIDFYITDCVTSTPGQISYSGEYKFLPFTKKLTTHIKYRMMHAETGCSNVRKRMTGLRLTEDETVSCNPAPQIHPNTWEYLHEIALLTGLGFASTHQCREIDDRLPRRLQNMTYREFIERQLLMSGVDENSMFDVWIDLYRYIVMVNVSWVLNSDITYKQLSIKANVGKNATDENLFESRVKEVYRTLTNFDKTMEPSNLLFSENNFTEIVDNTVQEEGIHVDRPVFQARGGSVNNNGNTNLMNTQSVMTVENSMDGQEIENYQTEKQTRVTVQVDRYNTNYQKTIRKKFFQLKRAKYYKLVLTNPNLGLQRGTLVNISYFTKDNVVKQKILEAGSNVAAMDARTSIEPDKWDDIDDTTFRDWIMSESTQIQDPSKCGLYYIDGMTFEYSYSENAIVQTLYLIKKGIVSNLQNNTTAPKFRPDEL